MAVVDLELVSCLITVLADVCLRDGAHLQRRRVMSVQCSVFAVVVDQ